jgi:hypothetical protein
VTWQQTPAATQRRDESLGSKAGRIARRCNQALWLSRVHSTGSICAISSFNDPLKTSPVIFAASMAITPFTGTLWAIDRQWALPEFDDLPLALIEAKGLVPKRMEIRHGARQRSVNGTPPMSTPLPPRSLRSGGVHWLVNVADEVHHHGEGFAGFVRRGLGRLEKS